MKRPQIENYSYRETNNVYSPGYESDMNIYIDYLERKLKCKETYISDYDLNQIKELELEGTYQYCLGYDDAIMKILSILHVI